MADGTPEAVGRDGCQVFDASRSTFSIFGGSASSSGAFAISAAAMRPLRCASRPLSRLECVEDAEGGGAEAQRVPDGGFALLARERERALEQLRDLGFLAWFCLQTSEQTNFDHDGVLSAPALGGGAGKLRPAGASSRGRGAAMLPACPRLPVPRW